jgi:hypothetical protein
MSWYREQQSQRGDCGHPASKRDNCLAPSSFSRSLKVSFNSDDQEGELTIYGKRPLQRIGLHFPPRQFLGVIVNIVVVVLHHQLDPFKTLRVKKLTWYLPSRAIAEAISASKFF